MLKAKQERLGREVDGWEASHLQDASESRKIFITLSTSTASLMLALFLGKGNQLLPYKIRGGIVVFLKKILKTLKNPIFLFLFAVTFISSCKKDDKDTEKPWIHVWGPMANDTSYGQIEFAIAAFDNRELKQLEIKLTDANGTEMYLKTQAIAGVNNFFSTDIIGLNDIKSGMDFNLIFTAKDKSDNLGTIIIPVFVKPL